MTKFQVKTFTPLAEARIAEIITRCEPIYDALAPIAAKAKVALEKAEYANLFEQKRDRDFLDQNFQQIGGFLNECGIVGYPNEKQNLTASGGVLNNNSYVIGAAGVALMNEYVSTKTRNNNAHKIEIVANADLCDKAGSYKTPDVLMQYKGVHSAWAEVLAKDLSLEKSLEKTYLVETYGTTGGNHWVAVTLRKDENEKSPLVELFDSSPGLMRSNLEGFQNNIASGWAASIAVNATLTKVLPERGLEFDLNKYYTNSEAFQMAGNSNCSIFSYEKAYITANLNREKHQASLDQHYRFENSLVGGKTELAINKAEIFAKGKIENPTLNMPPEFMFLSHFSSQVEKYLPQMEHTKHVSNKYGVENDAERRARYLNQANANTLIEQKSLRQKYGHLFEIITHPKFLELGERSFAVKEPIMEHQNSVYYPTGKVVPEATAIVAALDKFLPSPVKVNQCDLTAENCFQATIYTGAISAKRMQRWGEAQDFSVAFETQKFNGERQFNLSGMDEDLVQRTKVTLTMPRELALEKIEQSINRANQIKQSKSLPPLTPALYVCDDNPSQTLQPENQPTKLVASFRSLNS